MQSQPDTTVNALTPVKLAIHYANIMQLRDNWPQLIKYVKTIKEPLEIKKDLEFFDESCYPSVTYLTHSLRMLQLQYDHYGKNLAQNVPRMTMFTTIADPAVAQASVNYKQILLLYVFSACIGYTIGTVCFNYFMRT